MVVGQPIRKIGVGGGKRDLNLVIVELLDVRDALHRSRAARFCVAPVEVERINCVVGRELLAVGESYAFAQLEYPILCAVGRLPALSQFRMRSSILVPLGETVPDAVVGVDHHGIGGGAGVEAVGGAGAGEAEPLHPAT